MSAAPSLFSPVRIGGLPLPSRLIMAPMTRARAAQPGDIPTPLMAEYYAQRAGAGLILTEATQISPQGKGYSFTPGIHSPQQVDGWQQVTQAVHAAGGSIALQLWHVGRMSHPSLHADGQTVGPSAIAPDASVWIVDPATGTGTMLPCPVPRALTTAEVAAVVDDYRHAADNARAAGFDAVEIHAANGYLIDQFLRASANHRTDRYGGPAENRMRFLLEVVDAVAGVMGADRTGIRLSPFITQRGMNDPDIIPTVLAVAAELERRRIAYIHIAEADWDDAPETPEAFRHALRQAFSGSIIVAGGYTREKADAILRSGLADAVAFGRPFIANPDLPRRLRDGLPLAEADTTTLFGGGAEGYVTYPPLP
ncbi:alkene reductase [Novispirillum itersonii]|uniref:N-ethylmaleimide reductase n=1 Tax=Novispirillum itersonii TaxID=189 RepID=A0A7X0DMP0_NOVIT|nr:alkene reductase [Novispirillum itersonii]MBB6210484.1 N-ethylmaleimide reductase [Novispirillum itersonii]